MSSIGHRLPKLRKKEPAKTPVKWDKKSTYACLMLIIIMGVIIVLYTTDITSCFLKHNDNWVKTSATIVSVESIQGVDQTPVGNKLKNVAYKVRYSYWVDTILYAKESTIGASKYNRSHPSDKQEKNGTAEIYYKKSNPEQAYLISVNSN